MTRSERTLWRRWVERRDGEAFAALVRRHARFVYDFARRVAGNAADAEDLTQEAYLKLAEARPEEPDEVGLRAFLGRRVVLGARMLKRAALARRRHEGRATHPGGPRGPEEIERREQASRALEVLPDGERRAVELRFLHDLPYGEIAAILGTTEEAARMRVHRGLERMKSRLGRDASACLAAVALFEPPARMLASTAKTALLLGGVVVAQATGKKAAVLVGLALLLGILGTVAVHLATKERADQTTSRAPMAAAMPHVVTEAEPEPRALPPTPPSFHGVVVETTGRPVADATVRMLRGAGHDEWVETRTAGDGAFAFDLGKQEKCTVEARHPSYATTVLEDADPGVRLVLEPGVLVRVEVRGAGRPIRGARVAATASDAMQLCDPAYVAIAEGTSDTRGVAEIRVPEGRWEIWATAPGFAPKLAPPLICAKQARDVRLELEPGGIVEGTARDSLGALVSGARVVVQASPGFRVATATDADGRYSVAHVPVVEGPWVVVAADHPDHAATSAGGMWQAAQRERLLCDLFFAKTARIHGVALDATGEPLRGRRIACGYHGCYFHVLYGYPWANDSWPFACTTDERGRFEMAGIPPGNATLYLLPDFRDAFDVQLTPGGTHGPIELRLPGVAVRGRVLDSERRPIANAMIYPGDAVADAEGRFALSTRPGEIIVEADGHAPFRHVVEGEEIEVRLPAIAVAGVVIGPGGDGIADVTVRLQSQIGRMVYQTEARTDAGGGFRFRGASGGPYTLDVVAPGRELIGGERPVRGAQEDVVLVLATPVEADRRRVRGTVVDEVGRPIDDTVYYRPVSETRSSPSHAAAKRAGQEGSFVCEHLEPLGEMTIIFNARGYLNSDPIDVVFDGRTLVQPLTVALQRGAEVEVTVTEEDGTPVAGAFVCGYAANPIDGRTDAAGRCILEGIPPGRNRITVSHPYLTDVKEAYVDASAEMRQRVDFRGKAAGAIVALIPAEQSPRKSLLCRLLDAHGAIIREDRIEGARLALMAQQNLWRYDFAVTAAGTYRVRCEVDGVALPEAVVDARLRATTQVELKPPR